MKFKKFNKWSKAEEEYLTFLFNSIPYKSKIYSKNKKIQLLFNKRFGFRSVPAISRKLTKLGLRNYRVLNEPKVRLKCSVCHKYFYVPKRYKRKYVYCKDCRKRLSNQNYKNYKTYQRYYYSKNKKKEAIKNGKDNP